LFQEPDVIEAWMRLLAGPIIALLSKLLHAGDSTSVYLGADWCREVLLPEIDGDFLTVSEKV
jgi:hypothetical protein